jgi:hypothetical protein
MPPTVSELKTRLLSNTFVDRLRDGWRVDETAYADLCGTLRELARHTLWRAAALWEADLVAHLGAIGFASRNLARSSAEHSAPTRRRVAEVAEELDGLVFECLHARGLVADRPWPRTRLLDRTVLAADGAGSVIGLERESPKGLPWMGSRRLTIAGERFMELGFRCDTCALYFERVATTMPREIGAIAGPEALGTRLRAGVDRLDEELLALVRPILPADNYTALLLEIAPALVTPGSAGDYFHNELPALWGIDTFSGLPHHPRIAYYRTPTVSLPDHAAFFEFLVPLTPPSWLDADVVASHADALRAGVRPTALALTVLDVKQPADWDGDPEVTAHWCLAHYLLDGHHRVHAAAATAVPTRLLAFVPLGQSGASDEHLARLVDVLSAG